MVLPFFLYDRPLFKAIVILSRKLKKKDLPIGFYLDSKPTRE
jgi:hypothetical protein